MKLPVRGDKILLGLVLVVVIAIAWAIGITTGRRQGFDATCLAIGGVPIGGQCVHPQALVIPGHRS